MRSTPLFFVLFWEVFADLQNEYSAERRKERVCSEQTYDAIWRRLSALPPSVEHLIVQLGIPIAYPRMNFMEYVVAGGVISLPSHAYSIV